MSEDILNTKTTEDSKKDDTLEEDDEMFFEEEVFYDDAFDEDEAFDLKEEKPETPKTQVETSPEKEILENVPEQNTKENENEEETPVVEKKLDFLNDGPTSLPRRQVHTKFQSDGDFDISKVVFPENENEQKIAKKNPIPITPLPSNLPKPSPSKIFRKRGHRRTHSDIISAKELDEMNLSSIDVTSKIGEQMKKEEEEDEKEANMILKEIEEIDSLLKDGKDVSLVRKRMRLLERKHFKFFIELKYPKQFSAPSPQKSFISKKKELKKKRFSLAKAKLIVFRAKVDFHVKAYNKAIKKLRSALYSSLFDLSKIDRVLYMLALCYFCRASFMLNKKNDFTTAMNDYNEVLHYIINILSDYNSSNNDIIVKTKELLLKLFNNRGLTFKRLGLYNYAIHDYEQSLILDPHNIAVYVNIINAYSKLCKNSHELDISIEKRVTELFEKGLEIRKEQHVIFNSYGAFFFQRGLRGDCKEAIKSFSKALYFKKDFKPAIKNMNVAKKKLVRELEIEKKKKIALFSHMKKMKKNEKRMKKKREIEKKKAEKKNVKLRKTMDKKRLMFLQEQKRVYNSKKSKKILYKKVISKELGLFDKYILESYQKKLQTGEKKKLYLIDKIIKNDTNPTPYRPNSPLKDNRTLLSKDKINATMGSSVYTYQQVFKVSYNDINIHSYVNCDNTLSSYYKGEWYNIPISFKMYPTSQQLSEDSFKVFQNNVIKYMAIKHYNIKRLYGFDIQAKYIGVVTELCQYGSLKEYMRNNFKNVTMNEKIEFLYQVANGMRELHAKSIIVRDVTLENLYIKKNEKNEKFLIKINFGISKIIELLSITKSMNITTKHYIAPEIVDIFNEKYYTDQSDIYCYGIMMYKLLSYSEREYKRESMGRVSVGGKYDVNYKKLKNCPKWVVSMIRKCVSKKPEERGTFVDIAETFFLEGIPPVDEKMIDEVTIPRLITVRDRSGKRGDVKCMFKGKLLKELRVFVLKQVEKEHVKHMKVFLEVESGQHVEMTSDFQVENLEDGNVIEVSYEEVKFEVEYSTN